MEAAISLAERRLKREQRQRRFVDRLIEDCAFSTDCSICTELLYVLNFPAHDRIERDLGLLRRIRRSTCTYHSVLFPKNDELRDRTVAARRPTVQPLLYLHPDPSRSIHSRGDAAPWELADRGCYVPSFSAPNRRPQPIFVDKAWIDVKRLKKWLARCEEKHEACLSRESGVLFPRVSSLLLIDTERNCLVEATTDEHYLALSYVWGHTNTFYTTRERLPTLCKPGALDQSRRAILGLPRTISQAIALVRAMNEKYLWVDALCIVQDDDEKQSALNAMASIYANAIVTIVAADASTADEGFRGLRNISKRRNINQRVAKVSQEQWLFQPSSPHVWDESLLQPWTTRGWTYQEAICSSRLLIFANDSVRWCCKTARWSEESNSYDCNMTHGTTKLAAINTSMQISPSHLPSFVEYETVVNGFNSRNLTYAEDAFHAFAGISAQLGRKFDGAFVCGLPELFFEICLLWRPLRRAGPARRRQPASNECNDALPSWSWMGWATELSFPYTWECSSDPAGPLPVMLGGTTVWKRPRPFQGSEALNARPWPIINNWWLGYAQHFRRELEDGWTKRDSLKHSGFDKLAREYERLGNVSFYAHESDTSLEFCFPVPLCGQLDPPRLHRYIHFATEIGRFKLGEVRETMTRIHTLDGEPAGTLWQHDEEDGDFIRATTGTMAERPSIELILIMSCSYPKSEAVVWDVEDHLRDDYLEGLVEPKAFESVQNVLWVVRAGEVAYRKASGVIEDSVWMGSCEEEMINITLA